MTQILVELIKLANLIVSVTKAVACGNRIEKVLQMQPSLQFEKEGQTETQTENQDAFVCFDGASVRYNAGADCALEDVSFCVGQGQRVGIIGGTGSGKTTLVNLIARFYDVEKGGVFVGGKNVKAWDGEKLREMIAIVPQKAELFKGTVRENLLWGKADATDEELWSALKTAQADGVVQEKGGLDAIVERGGKNFSGGQRQRLTIARALVKKPQILILDDSSSALDYATDAALRKALKELQPCPTVFVVSQRTSALGGADQIVVLDDGKMVGLGTHETLLSSCETYREIYLSQYEGGETA
jgi:ABC-type multidrug transport system fused ATPase/permease subunit